VDGCDEIIKITKDGELHEIRYSPGLEIEGLKKFQGKLKMLMEEFREEN
jgi:hypothetical protein